MEKVELPTGLPPQILPHIKLSAAYSMASSWPGAGDRWKRQGVQLRCPQICPYIKLEAPWPVAVSWSGLWHGQLGQVEKVKEQLVRPQILPHIEL